MKLGLKKGLPKAFIFFSVITFIFVVLSYFNLENWMLRIITQAGLCLTMLFNGKHTISNKKEKNTGYLLILVSAFTFFVMINTIIVGFKIGAF